jgi:hypothetical protein
MTLLLKDPEAVLDYSIDWGAEYLGEDLIASSDWSVVPDEPDGVSVLDSSFDAAITTVNASGGIAGHVYKLINHVVLESGRIDDRSVVLRVEKR